MSRTDTTTLIKAMRILARDLPGDGVANAAIAEAADRLEEQAVAVTEHRKTTGDASADNVLWLLEKMRLVHDALCMDKVGTWQMEVEQAVEAAIDAGKTLAKLPTYATGGAFVPSHDKCWSYVWGTVIETDPDHHVGEWRFYAGAEFDYASSDRAYPTAAACEEAERKEQQR